MMILLGFGLMASCSTATLQEPHHDSETVRLRALIVNEIYPADSSLDPLDFSQHLVRLSRRYHLDPLLILAIMKVESNFQPDARSPAGAIGLMQLMPIVLREVGSDISVTTREDLYDPYKNTHLGIFYLKFLLKKYGNNLQKALAAYNVGPSALDLRLSQKTSFPSIYFKKVLSCYQDFQEKIATLPEMT